MKTIKAIIPAALLLFAACANNQNSYDNATSNDGVMEKDGITITAVESPQFEHASLTMKMPKADMVKAGKVDFEFDVKNYELGAQTSDAQGKGLANSDKGQHIHFIMDNEPYAAHYESKFTEEMPEGHHVVLAFLSRSYHESVKSNYVLQELEAYSGEDNFDENAPHIFYSRPKGDYKSKDANKVLLDWYLVNCDLSANGYKVKATINGTDFWFDEWQPYAIEGLPNGKNTVKLELFDKDGQSVNSPFNPVTREINVSKTITVMR